MSLGKHLLHVIVYVSYVILMVHSTVVKHLNRAPNSYQNDLTETNLFTNYLPYLLICIQLTVILALPQIIFNFLGIILFDAFPGPVYIKKPDEKRVSEMNLPHICFRVVTRGLFPELVQVNMNKNYQTCLEVGLHDFSIEVVTDRPLNMMLPDQIKCREILVPKCYQTSTKAMYKARALNYALSEEANKLTVGDYIVHLDEETLTTHDSIRGIINFILEGNHPLGQGLITYSNQGVVNWITTLADSFRVAEDMGKLRTQFKLFHKPIFSWKGSYVVTRYEVEADVTFDNGPDGSVAEDCYFALKAFSRGYTFQFIDGEMWEKSPYTILDLIRQRKRWIQGLLLVVHSGDIPIRSKFFLAISLYGWISLPLTTLTIFVTMVFPIAAPIWIAVINSFCFAVSSYMYMIGTIRSFDNQKSKIFVLFARLVGAFITLSLNIAIENVAVIWALFSPKHQFYIVNKDINPKVVSGV